MHSGFTLCMITVNNDSIDRISLFSSRYFSRWSSACAYFDKLTFVYIMIYFAHIVAIHILGAFSLKKKLNVEHVGSF